MGYCVSKKLTTEETTLIALKMAIALRIRKKMIIDGVVFHSDGGGQYYAKDFLRLTEQYYFTIMKNLI